MLRGAKRKIRLKVIEVMARSSAKIMTIQIDRAIAQIKKERGMHDGKKLSVR